MRPDELRALNRLKKSVGLELVLTHRSFRQSGEKKLARLGLRLGQELILLKLVAQNGLSQSQLAGRLGVEQATISIMLRRMERADLIQRRTDRRDARVTRVRATGKGRALVASVLRLWRDQERMLLRGLTDREKQTLRRLLIRVRANLEAERQHRNGGQ
jgi:MarR family transcriptional regulator, organic hydroperoxide resistance regulator